MFRTFTSLLFLLLSLVLLPACKSSTPRQSAQPTPPQQSIHSNEPLNGAKTVLFLGDSITHDGRYVMDVEACLYTLYPQSHINVIDLGLSSETVEGLTEEGHPYPRPNVQDRAGRALEQIKPDMVFICYGMNDGIYHPFSEERFMAYQDGILTLVNKVQAAGATPVVMTPTPFDVTRAKNPQPDGAPKYGYSLPYKNYDSVLAGYGQWILREGKTRGWKTIDLHTPLLQYTVQQRQTDPNFTLTPDAVHPNDLGHQLMAQQIIRSMNLANDFDFSKVPPATMKLIRDRNRLLFNAWHTAIPHTKPETPKGLPLAEAQQKAADLDGRIRASLKVGATTQAAR